MNSLIPTLPLVFPIVRGLVLVTLLLLIGLAASVRLVTKSLVATSATVDPRTSFWLRQLPTLLASFLLALCLARSLAQYLSFSSPGDPFDPEFAKAVVMQGTWGGANLLQTIVAATLLVVSILMRSQPRLVQSVLLLLLPLLITAESSMGHGVEAIWEAHWGQAMHSLHMFGAGIWLGTLAILSITVFPPLWRDDHSRLLSHIVRAFSVYARWGAGLVVFSGVNQSFHYLPSLGAFTNTDWGRLLLFKLVFFFGVLALGAWNWKRVTPQLEQEQPGSAQRLRWAVRVELILGVGMLVATAMLVGTELPNR